MKLIYFNNFIWLYEKFKEDGVVTIILVQSIISLNNLLGRNENLHYNVCDSTFCVYNKQILSILYT